ncbi:MAG TPA: ATP-binding protein, partial [Ramlibacter sp.]
GKLPFAARPPGTRRWYGDYRVQLWAGCALLLSGLWGVLVVAVLDVSRDAREQRRAAVYATATGFSEYVRLHLLQVDRQLLGLREAYRQTGRVPANELLSAEFRDMAPILVQVAVAAPDGEVVASSLPLRPGVSIADREHFREFLRDPADRLHVSSPVLGRVSNRVSIQLVRPLLQRDGAFGGVIVASIDPERLRQYFVALDAFSHSGAVSLVRMNDGRIFARFTRDGITWGQSIAGAPNWSQVLSRPDGTFEGRSAVDGSARIFGYRRAGGYPITVIASSEYTLWPGLADARSALAVAVAIVCTISLVLLTRLLVRRADEQQRVIARLQESRAREMEANRLKSSFLASVSHELRTPLNAILGFSELIRDHGEAEAAQTRQYADLIHRSGTHLHSLVNTLLDLAKIEAGRMEVQREPVDLGQLLGTLVDTHRVAAQKKGVRMEFLLVLPAGMRAEADTDTTKLTQIMNNVLHNAVKFTDQGSVRVSATVADGQLAARVVDTGCGIAADQLAHVFERFRRADGEFNGQEGTGLGLPLSRELATLLGGSIAIQSWRGKGTTVEVRLPDVRLVEQGA